ncbi:MAG TPA: beta-galactosidase, partial [Kineosporiaceae bacterium]|nr:beta-galactosidase [Kineosporiaceae bacterium]
MTIDGAGQWPETAAPEIDPAYPRPQLVREAWLDLSGPWQFAHDDADVGLDEGWFDGREFDRTIQVPYPPESPASGIGDTGYHKVVWYRRECERPAGERLLLHFGAVDFAATVWVNGRVVARHEGGHTPFTADVTGTGPMVIVVRAEDDPHDLTQPRGKQDWQEQPHAIWYERTTGIWQPVWLEPVPRTHVSSLLWIPDLDRSVLRLRARIAGPTQGLRLAVRLTLRGQVLADDVYPATADVVQRDIPLD